MWELDSKEGRALDNWCFQTAVLEKTLRILGKQGDQSSQSSRKSTLSTLWKDWCWSSNTLATGCELLTHWKRSWCWGRLKTEGEEGDRGWDSWMASPMEWTWTWANSRRWWGTERPCVLQSMGSQRVRHDLATEQQHMFNISNMPHSFRCILPPGTLFLLIDRPSLTFLIVDVTCWLILQFLISEKIFISLSFCNFFVTLMLNSRVT